jgi:hypothetical protein
MNYHQIANYNMNLRNFIVDGEGAELAVYNDDANYGIGYPTIGYGYALINREGVANWRDDFAAAGIDCSWGSNELNGQLSDLDTIIRRARAMLSSSSNPGTTSRSDAFTELRNSYNTTLDSIKQKIPNLASVQQAEALLQAVLNRKETDLFNLLVGGNLITRDEWNSMDGNDTIYGGNGKDYIEGGEGEDIIKNFTGF